MSSTAEKATLSGTPCSPPRNAMTPLAQNIAVALTYVVTAKLGFLLALEQTNATAVWPPTGIALAACLVFGFHLWPGIFLGAFLANFMVLTGAPFSSLPALLLSLCTAAGNTLEALSGAYLVSRFTSNKLPFDRTLDTVYFILLGALASPVISATIGTAGFCSYSSDWSRSLQIWITWWLGDAVGALVFAPLLLTWGKRGEMRRNKWQGAEAAALLALLLLAEAIIFSLGAPLEYLIFPLLFWTAFRFGQFETAVTVALVMVTFLLWTVKGFGPLAGQSLNYSLLFLQSYLGVAAASTLLLSTLVTSRNRTEEALRASEEKFRNIFEHAPVGIFQSVAGGKFIGLNSTLAAMFGYSSAQEMIGDVSDIAGQLFVFPDQRHLIVDKARNAAGFVREEVTYRRRDGSEFIANLYMRMLHDNSGNSNLEGFVEEITERKQAEERLRKYQENLETLVSLRTAELQRTNERLTGEIEERARTQQLLIERESQYRDLVESANSVILRWLPDGRITFFNRFARNFFGYSEEEIIGRNILGTIVPAEESSGRDLSAMVADIIAHPELYVRNENENVRKNGERVWVAWTNKPIMNADGTIAEILSIGVDITRLVHTERELRQALDELAVAKERAEAADQMKSAFLATMSHELRTPLNSIIGFTGVLLQGLGGPLNEEQAKQLSMVKNSANHLLSLISDVLDISKIEAGQLKISFEPFNLKESILKVVQSVRPLTEKKGVDLVLDMTENVASVCADERRVEQILLNLLSNAIKFTEQGTILVRCSREAGNYVTTVTDTGIGISAEDLQHLFKPFYQVEGGLSRRYEGTGLGLSICKRMVELMGGSIRVESSPGKGSSFSFTLPEKGVSHEKKHPVYRR